MRIRMLGMNTACRGDLQLKKRMQDCQQLHVSCVPICPQYFSSSLSGQFFTPLQTSSCSRQTEDSLHLNIPERRSIAQTQVAVFMV